MAAQPKDFLAVATPGAGKTTFALRLATEIVGNRTVDRVIVVVPTEHLKVQWAQAAERVGLFLDPHFTNTSGVVNPEYHGIVVTYAQVAMHPYKHRAVATAQRSLVILDEIHHGGDAKSWGDGIREAYDDAERRLALTGTPFRSDDAAIPFVRYTDDGEGYLKSRADHTYGYSDALADGVVRPVVFLAYSGEARWRTSAGEEFAARLGEPLNAEQTARAWKTALDPKGDWIPAVLRGAHTRLKQLRERMPDAGGLVIATDKTTARAYARILGTMSSTPVTVVLSDEIGASQRIEDFSNSTDEWMVAVRMVSEGVDVPRLAVGVYATSASTPLFFAQAIGRFVRSRMPGETASVFLPSVPVLLDLASRLETQRDHVLGKPDRVKEGWDDELLAEANREKNEPDDTKSYESIGAEAELDSLIYDGSTYGTGTIAGSAEEADYLGLPGLLDAEQMRQLLKQRQAEQVEARAGEHRQGQEKQDGQPPRRRTEAAATVSNEIPQLRKELNTLVSITSGRTGRPHGAIHNEVRQNCGGPPTALCTAEQLRDRIAYLRDW
ncbi:DEAD/DEAH box helicase [Corynebacterium sp. CCM 9187]|uniref:DEAD/DEAH box helicase n=1 Tax=Corynebacterium pygosceleis TaxID=2800406 RepID=A0A9Q4C6M2_9CORY|nr:DEAD/DEAH box helicase [Corynebacterium pygosceleis]MCK7636889.1 DEAD/DEAH box helicase [Corynebacterium pygosceleis]MCK7674363.1 DEAD/DEAH box helicase [Corynebacterium pygosceleis]MCL0120339.1 DEAD/DEAH box helicase [Corynebacterium pygosceleis]MCX7443886.1 DEAD/DEAH box helicase [Corynebacterium pygosceleis]MCX7467642.1 DEAD/DEAH box helicase [Corynebacterium pygosceleis]